LHANGERHTSGAEIALKPAQAGLLDRRRPVVGAKTYYLSYATQSKKERTVTMMKVPVVAISLPKRSKSAPDFPVVIDSPAEALA
jgi:hypothetical protein